MTTRKFFLNIFFILSVLILIGCVWLTWQWQRRLNSPLLSHDAVAVEIEIQPGTALATVAWQLKNQGLNIYPDTFLWWAKVQGALTKIKAGEYLIAPGKTTSLQLLRNMVAGKVIMRQITFVPGWTFSQVMDAINNNPYLAHTLNGLSHSAIMTQLGQIGINPEGRFFPDTYLFSKGTADTRILKKSFNAMQNLLNQAWNNRAPNLPYKNVGEALTAASLIEKETAKPSERPLIAGVIIQRLHHKMRLQIDPTVIYAMGDTYQGQLTRRNLKTVRSPYNTYLNAGLPPGPIALPCPASLNAALHPVITDAFYYVADGSGGHTFSATLKDQDKVIKNVKFEKKLLQKPAAVPLSSFLNTPLLKYINYNVCLNPALPSRLS